MTHPQVHHLQNPQTGQRSALTVSDNQVSTETQTSGKTQRTEKQFPTAEEAASYAERQEWALLKKGFVLHAGWSCSRSLAGS